MSTPKQWFAKVIFEELTLMYAMRFEGHPSQEVLSTVKEAWVAALWKGKTWEESDIPRLREGFELVRANTDKWIQPVQFLKEYLPARKQAPLLALPKPQNDYPKEKAAENLAKIRTMIKGAFGKQLQEDDAKRTQRIEEQKLKVDQELAKRREKIEKESVLKGGSICPHSGFDCTYFQDFTEALAYQLALAYSKGKRPKATDQQRHDHANRVKKQFLPLAIHFLRK
jgi:hypothetical protein